MLTFLFIFHFVRIGFADQLVERDELRADELAEAIQQQEGWNINLQTPLWLPPVDGTLFKQGLQSDFEASSSKRIREYQPSGELTLEAINGKWSFVFQSQYLDVNLDGNTLTPFGNVPLDINSKVIGVEYWVGRRFGKPVAWTEFIMGGRHINIEVDIQSPFGPDAVELDWHDPLIGFRQYRDFKGRWGLESLLTVSGFGISDNTTDRSWEARMAGRYKIGQRWGLQIGYRYYKTKYNENENTPVPSTLSYKVAGPFVGAVVKLK